MAESLLKGSCFCGSVSYSLSALPVLSAYCHCTNCQRLKGCPFVHTVHFEASAFKWTHTEPYDAALQWYTIPEKPHKTRYRCNICGACVASYNSVRDRWSIWSVHLERDSEGKLIHWDLVKPTAHIFYGTRILDINDGLGKWEGYEGISTKIA
ncbi:unnamed protein product [Somion occarium]|uniref:CENP-V/GFA domain-containing protein n=1 Tax=Somion occarium TaxID=3059160 RepID=A0ABP1CY97_9APHY